MFDLILISICCLAIVAGIIFGVSLRIQSNKLDKRARIIISFDEEDVYLEATFKDKRINTRHGLGEQRAEAKVREQIEYEWEGVC
ncbi:MAG TPA: hypothetical protein VKZ68_06730 [Ohtaekwangia sp.]|nr:hypothetical protein [Ohtaekwangia sp.]